MSMIITSYEINNVSHVHVAENDVKKSNYM